MSNSQYLIKFINFGFLGFVHNLIIGLFPIVLKHIKC